MVRPKLRYLPDRERHQVFLLLVDSFVRGEFPYMKERTLDKDSPIGIETNSSHSRAYRERTGRRNDWTNSDWLSDWLKLARQRTNQN
jgi:hypothetical protein